MVFLALVYMPADIKETIKNLPNNPAVYLFKDQSERVIYVGKAKNLKKRISSHFQKKKDVRFDFYNQVADIDFIKCRNEKEALILENDLIKKFMPKYNVEWRDDKNYPSVGFTKENFPRLTITHRPQKENLDAIGPFISGTELKSFLKNIRKIIPYRTCRNLPKKPCLYADLKLCPAPCINKRQKKRYNKAVSLLKTLLEFYAGKDKRLEGYDISNLSGTLATGSMIVFEKNKKKTSDYRLFKVKTIEGQNDVGSLKEVIKRRLNHPEWKMPNLMLVDGGKPQLSAVKDIEIPVLAISKERSLGKFGRDKIFSLFSKNPVYLENIPEPLRNLFIQSRDEAHRFAITFQKKRRIKELKL